MAEEKVAKELSYWACTDLFPKKDIRTVGDVSSLVCSGMDPIEPGGTYKFKLMKENEHALKILKTLEDTPLKKTFEIVPYVVAKGDLKLIFVRDGEEVFEAVYKGFSTTSVLKGEKNPVPPVGPGYVLPNHYFIAFMVLTVLAAIGFLIYRSVLGIKTQAEYRSVVSKARYADPFMDFNIEIRELDKERKFSAIFLDRLEETFKKAFFRIFEDNVFFDEKSRDDFFRALRGMGAEPHEVRSFYVLEEEYNKFTNLYRETRGQVKDQKKDFMALSRRTVSKLKKYKAEVSQL